MWTTKRLRWFLALGLGSLGCVSLSCRSRPSPAPVVLDDEGGATPDRLKEGEELPESETAFGLPIPQGMRLSRHFLESAYLTGSLSLEQLADHVQSHVEARNVEVTKNRVLFARVLFARARIKGDRRGRLFRLEISRTASGAQLFMLEITPPAMTRGLTEAERWREAGRNPDGTLLDENRVY
jgi:hypothetical protein